MISPLPSQRVRTVASLALAGLLVYVMYQLLLPFLVPLAAGAIIALVCRPLYVQIKRAFRNKELSAVVTVLIFVALILVPVTILGTLVVREIMGLSWTVRNPSDTFYHFNHMLDPLVSRLGIAPTSLHLDVKSYLVEAVRFIGDRSTMLIGGLVGGLATVAMSILTTFYLLCSHEEILVLLKAYSPLNRPDTELLMGRIKDVVRATVNGNLILVVIEALLAMTGFALFGLVSPVLLGLCFGISSLIPVVGASIVWVPIVLFEVLQGNWLAAIGIGLWAWVQVGLCDYYIGPRLIERRAQLHPFVVLLGILGGVAQFGVLGAILGPTIMAVGIVGLEIVRRTWQIRPD